MSNHQLDHEVLNQEKKPIRPQPEEALRCPRCDSTNTKFCYYNNYSLSQPRYFCRGCRRYWTKGGSLRNVPVGGGCRKKKRSASPSSTSNPTTPSKKPFSSFHSHHQDPFFLLANPNPNPNGPVYYGGGGGGLHSFYYGLSGGDDDIRDMLSFDGGVGGCSDSTAVVVGNSDPASKVDSTTSAGHGSLGMESGRDYWNAVAPNSSWHGLINSSLL